MLVKEFKKYLEALGYSSSSTKMLPSCLRDFLVFINKNIQDITSQDIIHFHNHLQNRPNKKQPGGLSESYINHHIYALKLFFAWQLESGKITENPMSILSFPAPQTQPREILNQEEIQRVYAVCESLKERAILGLFYGCGLRRSEGEKLDLRDLDFSSGLLFVREGKGRKRRAVPMSGKVKYDLQNYALNERRAKVKEEAFICNRAQARMRGSSFNHSLKKIILRTEISKQITLHSLRHSIATHLLESGLSVEYVRDFLGHKHLESTQIYTRIKQEQLWNLTTT